MFAIIETGGKQYKVEKNTIIDIEKIDSAEKQTIEFDKILLISNDKTTSLGKPYVNGAKVKATILENFKDKKILVFKFKRKTGYKKTQGHRQPQTRIKITDIIHPASGQS